MITMLQVKVKDRLHRTMDGRSIPATTQRIELAMDQGSKGRAARDADNDTLDLPTGLGS